MISFDDQTALRLIGRAVVNLMLRSRLFYERMAVGAVVQGGVAMDRGFPADQVSKETRTVDAISESWSCPSCGVRFSSTPPDHRLCGDCLGQLESLGYEPAPGAPYGDLPPCPDCGGQMVEIVQIVQPPDVERSGRRR